MSLNNMNIDWKYVKSYASEKALQKRIDQVKDEAPDCRDRFLIIKTPEDRWTALVVLDRSAGGYLDRYDGFVKV